MGKANLTSSTLKPSKALSMWCAITGSNPVAFDSEVVAFDAFLNHFILFGVLLVAPEFLKWFKVGIKSVGFATSG